MIGFLIAIFIVLLGFGAMCLEAWLHGTARGRDVWHRIMELERCNLLKIPDHCHPDWKQIMLKNIRPFLTALLILACILGYAYWKHIMGAG